MASNESTSPDTRGTPGGASTSSGGQTIREIETKTSRMPLFYGRTTGQKSDITPRAFVERIEAYCKLANKAENAECHVLYDTLRGEAITWWEGLKDAQIDKTIWAEVKREFLIDYDYRIAGESEYKLKALKQKVGENAVTFFSRVSAAMEDIDRGIPEHATAEGRAIQESYRLQVHKNLFISGLREDIRTNVLNHPIPDLRTAKEEARRAEFLLSNTKPIVSSQTFDDLASAMDTVMAIEPRENDEEELHEDEIAAINNWRIRRGRKPVKWNNRRRNNGYGSNNSGSTPFQGKCHNCDKMGHMARNCREPKRAQNIRAIEENKEANNTRRYEGEANGPVYSTASVNW